MNKELISALRTENWAEIRRIAFALPEQEKTQIKKQTQHKKLGRTLGKQAS